MFQKFNDKKTLRTFSANESNRKRSKLIALCMLVIMLITITTGGASAATVDAENTGSTMDIEHFSDEVINDFRSHENISRSPQRTYIFYDTYNLIKKYNNYCKKVTNWCNTLSSRANNKFSHINTDKASELATDWQSLFYSLRNLYDTVSRSCFSSDSNGEAKWRGYENGKYYYGVVITDNDYNNMRKNISSCTSTLNKTIDNFKKAIDKINENNVSSMNKYVNNVMDGQYKGVTYLWKQLGNTLKDFGSGNSHKGKNIFGISWGTNSMKKLANVIAPITKAFAYALVVILFGLNMTNTMLQFDFTSMRGIIKVIGTLLIAKIWIDLSVTVCAYIINTVNTMNSQIISQLKMNAKSVIYTSAYNPNTSINASSWNFIGSIIGFFQSIFFRGPELILLIVLGIAIVCVFIKILSRAFELTCLMAISPLAFSCVACEESKVYFKKFIGTFLSTCLYMTFMIICYVIGSEWLAEVNNIQSVATTSFLTSLKQIIPRFVVIFGICRIMAKPPKSLTNLID